MISAKKSNNHLQWERVGEKPHSSFRIFDVITRKHRHPETHGVHDFVVLDCPDWVNVIVLTPENKVVLVRQFRYGTETVTLEIPGGMVDPGEEALEAGKREVREETGYVAERWIELGVVEPNPAFQTNRCWTFLALDAHMAGAIGHDSTEVIDVELVPLEAIPGMIAQGEIQHSLVIAGFFHLINYTGGWHRPRIG